MPAHFNAAFRVHAVLEEAARQDPNIQTSAVWFRVFSIPTDDPIGRLIDMAVMVGKLYDELKIVHEQMKGTNFTASKYERVFENAYKALNIEAPTNQWVNYRNYLSDSVISMLSFFSEVLEHEEDPISQEDLASLDKELNDLEVEVLSGSLPNDVKQFILKHIRIIQNAIRLYRIMGKKAFTEAFVQATTTLVQKRDLIQKNKDSEEFKTQWQKLTEAWNFIKERTDDVQTLLALYGGAQALYDGANIGLQLIRPLLGH